MMEHSPTTTPSPDILVPHTQSTDGEMTQDTAMPLGGGQNTNRTGIGDSIHAPNSCPPEERRVRFSSLPPPHRPSTVPPTDSGNFTPITPRQRHTNDLWNLAQPVATTTNDKGKGTSPQTRTPPNQQTTPCSSSPTTTANTTTTPNTPDPTGIPHDILDAPITHAPMLTIMADMENRFEFRLRAMANCLLARRNNANNSNNSNNNPRPQLQPQQQQQQQLNPNPNTIQILQQPPHHNDKPNPPTTNDKRGTATPNTTTTNSSIQQTWAAITATGIDLDGFRLTPTRKSISKQLSCFWCADVASGC